MIDFMILGAQKAATSSLQAALRQINDIYMPLGESAFFEDPDFEDRPWERFSSSGHNVASPLLGIKRPDNLCTDYLIKRIGETLPNLKFIVVMREPVSRAVSSYYHMMRHGHLPILPLNEGMESCIEQFKRQDPGRAKTIIEYGLYGAYIKQWFALYSAEQFLFLSHKAVAADTDAAVARCCAHLGVAHEYVGTPEIASKNLGFYGPWLIRLHHSGHMLKTKKLSHGERRIPTTNTIARIAGQTLTLITRMLARHVKQSPENLSQSIRAQLDDIYDLDLQQLCRLVPADSLYWVQNNQAVKSNG